MPKITILQEVCGEDAHKLASCFPKGVIDVVRRRDKDVAIVKNARLDTMSRECLRHPEFSNRIQLSRVPEHFICKALFSFIVNIESTGCYSPHEVVCEAIKTLRDKCDRLISLL